MPQKKNARTTRVRRSERKNIAVGQAHIKSTFNNTIISITDPQGNVVSWQSGGTVGFKGSRKSTPFAASLPPRLLQRRPWSMGRLKVRGLRQGPWPGRETAIRSLQAAGPSRFRESRTRPPPRTTVCRPCKRRRV